MVRRNERKSYKNNEEDDLSERIFTAVLFLYLLKSNYHSFPLFDTKKEGEGNLDLCDILKPWDVGYRTMRYHTDLGYRTNLRVKL